MEITILLEYSECSAQYFRKSSDHLLRVEQYRDYLKIIVNSVHSSSLLVRSSVPLWARII